MPRAWLNFASVSSCSNNSWLSQICRAGSKSLFWGNVKEVITIFNFCWIITVLRDFSYIKIFKNCRITLSPIKIRQIEKCIERFTVIISCPIWTCRKWPGHWPPFDFEWLQAFKFQLQSYAYKTGFQCRKKLARKNAKRSHLTVQIRHVRRQ